MKLFDDETTIQETMENVETKVQENTKNTTNQFTLDSFS